MRTCELFLRYSTPYGYKYQSLDFVLSFGNKHIHHGNHDGIVYEQFGDLFIPVKSQNNILEVPKISIIL